MNQGHTLIDAAVKVCGSRYAVSKRTGIPQSSLSNFYSGKRPLTPKVAGKLAAVAGLNAQEAAAVAIIEAEEDPAEREELKRVFFRAGGVAMLLFFISVLSLAPSPAMAAITSNSLNRGVCILC